MKSILKIIKATFLGGILFLAPLVLLLVILEKGYHIIQKITLPIISHFPKVKILGLAIEEIIAIIIIFIICISAGLVARTTYAKRLIQRLENGILSFIPGYSFIKKTNENIMGFESNENLKGVLVPTDAGLQFAFLIEEINDNNFSVFVPAAPNPWSGSICFVEKKDIKEVGISQKEALACIRKLGFGSAALLKDKL
ncbi:hypothetical protein B0A67_17465 [Flavobacterium aquidurense]|uniref:DUF502 domain-containing protein n=1 Tax=Flavobacterium aquidurense TaxID=362413 RepID=UPI00091D0EF2|nr:DUF502 domain-containing protein [Flavobacterium aquidurense]OXA70100.1 hypothetical protein B0A67_17465 [Flavobacterium aquidurense]SHG13705.1 Uncharacterized membrane protein [Flavobacterium frigidimaris]